MDIKEYLANRNRGTYQRDEFDSFLRKRHFSYDVPSIHIAGSNGKGSTAKYLMEIYKAQGYKVGLYNSPYYQSPCEMISINGEKISEESFEKYLSRDAKDFQKFDLSEFEIETYIALNYFKDEKVDIAIIECGMGGELDATNVFIPILSIITTISLEHTSFLGRSLSEIALQKAGIIKDKIPVLIGNNFDEDVLKVLADVAKENRTKITTVDQYHYEKLSENGYEFTYNNIEGLKIKTPALFSLKDACFALEAVKMLHNQFPVSEESMKKGLLNFSIPARMSIKIHSPLVIVDGAHNPESIHALCEDISNIAQGEVHVILASFRDKNIERILSELNFVSHDILITTFNHPRARTEEEYFVYLGEYKFDEDYHHAIQSKIDEFKDDTILICGSLAFAYLINDEFDRGVYVKNENIV